MKVNVITFALFFVVLSSAVLGQESASAPAPATPPVGPNPAAADRPEMQLYYINDAQAGMPVYAVRGPVGWQIDSTVQWNLANNVVPVTIGAILTDPANTKCLQLFPELTCYWLTGDAALNNPGAMNMGMLNVAPMEPIVALVEAVTKIYQSDIPGLTITGVRNMPGLPAALGQAGPNVTGVGLRAEFDWQGKRMEQEIYGLYMIGSATLRGEAGVTTQTTWGLTRVHGFITELGKMDENRSMFTYMVRSGTPNPAWVQLHQNIKQQLDNQFRQELADNRRAREAIMAQSRALAAENEAFRNNIMARHRAAMDDTSHKRFIDSIHSGDSPSSVGGRSSQDKLIDSIHDVETYNDAGTVTGTSQHGYAKQHWTDGWGNYIHSDNVNYDPNIGSTIEWQKMERLE